MRLEVTRRADLAVRAVGLLAAVGRRVKGTELAELLGTTVGFVPQIIGPLVQRGWIRSDPGPTGGDLLHRRRRSERAGRHRGDRGADRDGACGALEDRPCQGVDQCALHAPWAHARSRLLDGLAATPVIPAAASGSAR